MAVVQVMAQEGPRSETGKRAVQLGPRRASAEVGVYSVPMAYVPPLTRVDLSRRTDVPPLLDLPPLAGGELLIDKDERLTISILDETEVPDLRIVESIDDTDLVEIDITYGILDTDCLRRLQRCSKMVGVSCMVKEDDHVFALCKNWPQLRTLILHDFPRSGRFTDRGLEAMKSLHNLQSIQIQGSAVTRLGFCELAKLPNLVGLEFTGNRTVRGEDIALLARSPHLREVVLWVDKQFTDAELQQFAVCRELKHVCVFGAERVTKEGIDSLQKKLPDCILHVRARIALPSPNDFDK